MALKDLGYSDVCCRCGHAATTSTKITMPGSLATTGGDAVQELKISLDDNCRIVRLLCDGCISSFESMYREWWEKKS